MVVIDSSSGKFNSSSCVAAGRASGVLASGVVYSLRATRSTQVPSALFQLATVSPGLLSVIDPNFHFESEGIYVLGDQVADSLGYGIGSRVSLVGEPVGEVGGIERNAARAESQSRWIFRAETHSATQTIEQCWLEADVDSVNAVLKALPAVMHEIPDLRLRTLSSRDVFIAAKTAFESRASKYAWVVGGLLMAAVTAMGWIGRRSEYALYTITGFPGDDVRLLMYGEYWIMAGIAFIWGVAGAWFIATLGGIPSFVSVAAGLVSALMVVALGAIICAMSTLFFGGGDVARALKNRD
ncbi:hypothetical protein [Microbacterium sp. 22242]|uniref:hypothetical protein n=1 Tax=Microbacterium sp. 22242 TaxID=3453896 RepID=UPI003F85F5C7